MSSDLARLPCTSKTGWRVWQAPGGMWQGARTRADRQERAWLHAEVTAGGLTTRNWLPRCLQSSARGLLRVNDRAAAAASAAISGSAALTASNLHIQWTPFGEGSDQNSSSRTISACSHACVGPALIGVLSTLHGSAHPFSSGVPPDAALGHAAHTTASEASDPSSTTSITGGRTPLSILLRPLFMLRPVPALPRILPHGQ
jgi:hypothetical protein